MSKRRTRAPKRRGNQTARRGRKYSAPSGGSVKHRATMGAVILLPLVAVGGILYFAVRGINRGLDRW